MLLAYDGRLPIMQLSHYSIFLRSRTDCALYCSLLLVRGCQVFAESCAPCLFLRQLQQPSSTLFPYTTLFRSYIDEEVKHDWQGMCNKVCAMCDIVKAGDRVLLVSGFSDDPELNEPVMKLMYAKSKFKNN